MGFQVFQKSRHRNGSCDLSQLIANQSQKDISYLDSCVLGRVEMKVDLTSEVVKSYVRRIILYYSAFEDGEVDETNVMKAK